MIMNLYYEAGLRLQLIYKFCQQGKMLVNNTAKPETQPNSNNKTSYN